MNNLILDLPVVETHKNLPATIPSRLEQPQTVHHQTNETCQENNESRQGTNVSRQETTIIRQGTNLTEIPHEELEAHDDPEEMVDVVEFLQQERSKFITWEEYKIDWMKIPAEALEQCASGTNNSSIINQVVHVIGNMRFQDIPIKSKDLEIIAKQFRDKFPKSFEDIGNDGKRMDNGYNGILSKLKEHNNYRNKRSGGLNSALQVPLKLAKSMESRKSGTVNWQPDNHPEGETEESLISKQDFLKTVDFNSISEDTEGDINEALTATYASQRLFINAFHKAPPLDEIKKEWPCLLTKKCLFWHFNLLTGCSIDILL